MAVADEDTPRDACPDGGRCWHYCPIVDGKGLPCWRVSSCVPFSDHNGDGRWSDEEEERHDPGINTEAVNDR